MRARLWRGELHYAGVTLHTATSGAINGLDTLWITLDEGAERGVGEVRLNIHYLHCYSAAQVLDNLRSVLAGWDWSADPATMLDSVHAADSLLLPPGCLLLDMALHDLLARRAQQSLAAWLGGTPAFVVYPTNQTLFWGSEQQMVQQATRYVERGFTQLKLRTGVAAVSEDVRRLQRLRKEFGDNLSLAIDVNGQWSAQQARDVFPQLAELGLAYIEQPLSPADDHLLPQLTAFGVPIMLDESLCNGLAIERLIAAEGALWAHLKLVKCGGIRPALALARRLQQADIPFMIGQMNEGHVATAAALQLCHAVNPIFAELYGADGLTDDPASGLYYHQGEVLVRDSFGLGVNFDDTQALFLQEFFYATDK
ncbi:MAG: N-succinyl-L-Arg/Lys racemase [Candidatus Erwinia impunctatus]